MTRTLCLPRISFASVLAAALAAAAVSSGSASPPFPMPPAELSPHGLFRAPSGSAVSPLGTYRLEYSLAPAPENRLLGTLEVTSSVDGRQWVLRSIPGPAFYLTDLGRIAALETFDPPELPGTLRIYDLEGRELHQETLQVPTDPVLSTDGASLVCRTADEVVRIDLRTFERTSYPAYDLLAAGPGGMVGGAFAGGALEVRDGSGRVLSVSLPGSARRLAFAADGSALLVLQAGRLLRIDSSSGEAATLLDAEAGEELMDLRVLADRIEVGGRRLRDGRTAAWLTTLGLDGNVVRRDAGPSMELPRADFSAGGASPAAPGRAGSDASGSPAMLGGGRPNPTIPWPLQPNTQHPVGNTYNEYQNYGGSPYPHPGIDVFGSPGQHVYSVRSGVVKAILTTGGDLYWRVAIADTAGTGILPGYMYAHLVQSSIPLTVGQQVLAGQYIGDLVTWPILDFTHTHFARVQDTGAQWHGAWICIGNPHLHLQNQTDNIVPVFEPARGSDLLAFCANETSTYQSPNSLHGAVDIIAHVGDIIVTHYVCTVQELRYTIYPLGHIDAPVVDNKLAVFFDMMNDYYAGGSNYILLTNTLYKQDSVCHTYGDYDNREFFHILTNSDEDQSWGPEDAQQNWDTSALPDGYYVIRVTAWDVAGSAVRDSMTVQTVNGNPSSVDAGPAARPLLESRPNPAVGSATIVFSLANRDRASLAIYDLGGRKVRSLVDAVLPAGNHQAGWDGRDEAGLEAPEGVYFYRLSSADGVRTGRVVFRR